MNAIEVIDVSKRFGPIVALDKVCLEVRKGEIMGLLGPNGAGKTTLISIMACLLSRDGGMVKILGKDIDKDVTSIKSRTNIVSGFSVVSASMRVDEFLRYYGMVYGIPQREKRMHEVMALTGILEKRDQIVDDLSAGFKQRVLLAKALLNKPDLLFLDEPTVGLDVEIAIRIRELVRKLGKDGTTVIFTSHNLHEVEEICDRITLIMHGKIMHVGTVAEVKRRKNDSIIIEITCKDASRAAERIRNLAKKVTVVGPTLMVEARESKQQEILDAIITGKVGLYSFSIVEPTLEDVFLELVRS